LSGIQQLAHDANLLFYGSEEAKEGREAYKQKASRLARFRDGMIGLRMCEPHGALCRAALPHSRALYRVAA